MNQKQEREVRDVTKTDYLNQVLQLMERFTESEMTGLQLEVDGLKLNLKKEVKEIVQNIASTPMVQPVIEVSPVSQTQVMTTAPIETTLPKEQTTIQEVKAPLVGTFYGSNAPGAKAFVSVGDQVKKGQPLCIIEAMKVMNEIESPCDGIIKEIKVTNEEAIGYDQVLMLIEV